jgi:tetratricopeptide (TPR) repeat protein
MGTRFRRSIRIAPGAKLNLTKTGLGMTVGTRGAHYSVHSSGMRTRTMGLPGTGLYYQSRSKSGTGSKGLATSPKRVTPTGAFMPINPAQVIPKPGLFASRAEKAYQAGVLAHLADQPKQVLASFEQVLALDASATSAHLFAGIAANELDDAARAMSHLEAVIASARPLPDRYQAKYIPDRLLSLSLGVKITETITGQPPFSEFGATLALAELYQTAGRLEEAIGLLQQLHEATMEPLVRLSLCDLLFADHDYEAVVETASGVTNDSDVSVETLHLRGAALMALGHGAGAIDAFRDALSRTAGRDAGLLAVVRYDRALAYERLGQNARAKADLERIYATDPRFEDVKARLEGRIHD